MLRFTEDTFDPDQPSTIGVDFKVKTVSIEGNSIKLAIWDTAGKMKTFLLSFFFVDICQFHILMKISQLGQERFRTLTPSYYRGAQGVILAYDVTSRASFDRLEPWLNELETFATKHDVVKMLVGNKKDKKPHEITREEGLEFARKHHMLFIESSAKTKEGVQCAFEELVEKVNHNKLTYELDKIICQLQIIQTPGLWEARGKLVNLNSASHPASSCYCSVL